MFVLRKQQKFPGNLLQTLERSNVQIPVTCCLSSRLMESNDGSNNASEEEHDDNDDSRNGLYLHVGPSGDFWTGYSIFAAKHLQPDYVKSIPLTKKPDANVCVDTLLELLENNNKWAHEIYDMGKFPHDLQQRLDELTNKK